jgi:hypothetical protein
MALFFRDFQGVEPLEPCRKKVRAWEREKPCFGIKGFALSHIVLFDCDTAFDC